MFPEPMELGLVFERPKRRFKEPKGHIAPLLVAILLSILIGGCVMSRL